ncbi:MAG: LysM domain-containing protein [Pseudomonadota bacterium]
MDPVGASSATTATSSAGTTSGRGSSPSSSSTKAAWASAEAVPTIDAPQHQVLGDSLDGLTPDSSVLSSSSSSTSSEERRKAGKSTAGAIVETAGSKVEDHILDTLDAASLNAIDRLNSDGDTVYLRTTLEGQAQIGTGVPGLAEGKLGVRGQDGGDLEITQIGDGPDARYRMTAEKHALAALTGKLEGFEQDIKVELGIQSFDRVEMTFDNRKEAERAARIIQRVAFADAVSDASSTLAPAGSLTDAGSNPAANPLNESGAPSSLSLEAVGVAAADIAFLQDNITAVETTFGPRSRIATELGPSFDQIGGFTFEGRLDGQPTFSRRIDLLQNGEPGQLTYTAAYDIRMSGKEKGQVGVILGQNRIPIGEARQAFSIHFALPPGDLATSPLNRSAVPEANLASAAGGLVPNGFSAKTTIEYRDQTLLDPSRANTNRLTLDWEMTNPGQAQAALGELALGDINAAMRTAGVTVSSQLISIERDGLALQGGFKLDAVIAGGEGSIIVEAGFDDVVGTGALTVTPRDPSDPPDPIIPPAPIDDGQTLVVEPSQGLALRDAPNGDRTAVFQNGTFLRRVGGNVVAADGSIWVPVTGTDHFDQQVEGFVNADYVRSHSSATGAMADTGRINPSLEYERFDKITVVTHDSLWDLAAGQGIDFVELVALNQDHIIDPDLIFAGDTVYVPGTAKGPDPVILPIPPSERYWDSLPNVEVSSTGQSNVDGISTPVVGAGGYAGEFADVVSANSRGSSDSSSSTNGDVVPIRPGESVIPTAPTTTDTDSVERPNLDQILGNYQVVDDEEVEYTPNLGPFPINIPLVGSRIMTRTEADLLDQLGSRHGILGLREFQNIASNDRDDPGLAYRTADEYFPRMDHAGNPIAGAEDGHNDAFRHTYWNALMTSRFGEDFAGSFATAHEAILGNPADKEAMDLYNNELGRRIATENPDASYEELADLVYGAIINGDAVVIDANGELAFSDDVAVGASGFADDPAVNGVIAMPEVNSN